MGKNNDQKNMVPERRNFKLYKTKKQWITACATFLLTFGATAVLNVSANAETNANPDNTSETTEIVMPTSASDSVSNSGQNEASSQVSSASSVSSSATTSSAANSTVKPNSGSAVSTIESEAPTSSSAATGVSSANQSSQKLASAAVSSVTKDDTSAADDKQLVASASGAKDTAADSGQKQVKVGQSGKAAAAQTTQTVKESKTATENIAPIQWKDQDGDPWQPYVGVGTDLKNDPAVLIPNGAALIKAGAKITLESLTNSNSENITSNPEITQTDVANGVEYNATLKITYADGTVVPYTLAFYGEQQATAKAGTFYYVPNVGDTVTDLNTPDANGRELVNADDSDNSLIDYSGLTGNQTDITAKLLKPLDTSTMGIHYAEVEVTDNNNAGTAFGNTVPLNGIVLGNKTYTIKIPYVVQGLKLRTDIPVDSQGNPVINAQLATNASGIVAGSTYVQQAFDPTQLNTSDANATWGKYFYQDYDQALKLNLGIHVSAANWTDPTDLQNAKTNSFNIVLSGCAKAVQPKIIVNYVAAPTIDPVYFYSNGTSYQNGLQKNKSYIENLFNSGDVKNQATATALNSDGHPVKLQASSLTNATIKALGNAKGLFTTTFDAHFNQTNSAGQPLIWSNWNKTWGGLGTATWNNLQAKTIALALQ